MKKAYMKPEIVFESFQLSTNIATVCERRVDTKSNDDCGIQWGFKIVFADTPTSQCTQKIGEHDIWAGVCYHNPSEDSNLFAS